MHVSRKNDEDQAYIQFISDFILALRWVYTVSVFRTFSSIFLHFCFFMKKYVHFRPHFYMFKFALAIVSHSEQKFSEKSFYKGVVPCFQISLSWLIHKIFEQNFYRNIAVYLVRMWTYKNADEKALTF